MRYRRTKVSGATYFFTAVTYDRKPILCITENADLLRRAFKSVIDKHPFVIDAIVLLPDHIHCMWTLPTRDADFSTRWRLIKTFFTRHCGVRYKTSPSGSRFNKNEQTVWQRRFWEHLIRDEQDFIQHVEYIHYNPVKHGLTTAPKNWKYSSFHRAVNQGTYEAEWGAADEIAFSADIGYE